MTLQKKLLSNMRISALVCCLLFAMQLHAQSLHTDAFYKDIVLPETQSAMAKMQVINYAYTDNYDLHWQELRITILPEDGFITGVVDAALTITESTDFIYFDCSDSLEIMAVSVNGSGVDFEHTANAIYIPLGETFAAGTSITTSVSYFGFPTATGLGSFMQGENEAGTLIWTLSQPYGASDWFPCKQSLSDKLDSVSLQLKVPQQYQTGAPGLLVNAFTDDEGMTTYTWKHYYPIATYLIGIVVGRLEEYTFEHPVGDETLLMQKYSPPEALKNYIEVREDFTD